MRISAIATTFQVEIPMTHPSHTIIDAYCNGAKIERGIPFANKTLSIWFFDKDQFFDFKSWYEYDHDKIDILMKKN